MRIKRGRIVSFLSVLLFALLAFSASASAAQNAMWIMDDLNVTQVPGGDFSHAGTYNFDIVGVNNWNVKAPFDCKIVALFPGEASGNTIIVQSLEPVQYANGTVDYMSMAFGHDNDIGDCYVGKTFSQGAVIGQNGDYGRVTGVHSHVTIIQGRYTDHPGWIQVSTGNYTFKNGMHPVDALFISDSTRIYQTLGLSFKKASSTGTLSVGCLADGKNAGGGTFDVYVNGTRVADDVKQYSAAWAWGSSYMVNDIRPVGEYTYEGNASYSGTISDSAVNVQLPFSSYGTLVVNGSVNGQTTSDISGYGTFDLYIDGILKADDVTKYSGKWPKNTNYSIEDVKAAEGQYFCGPDDGKMSGVVSANETTTVTLPFSVYVAPTDEWQESDFLPGNITAETCDIEYNHYYSQTASSAPGVGWVAVGDPIVTYVKSGGPYESSLPLATSDLVRLDSYYYYHFCGPYVSDANYCYTNSYVHFDAVNASDVYVVSTGTDTVDARYTFYNLRWNSDGSWAYCGGGVTCDGSYGAHGARCYAYYRMYVYQNYTADTKYVWAKESGWVTEMDASAERVKYRFRKKESEPPVLVLPAGLIKVDESAFEGNAALCEVVIPNGAKTIGGRAFANCAGLNAVYVPDSVVSIADDAFEGSENVVLICSMNSTAAAYAKACGLACIIAE